VENPKGNRTEQPSAIRRPRPTTSPTITNPGGPGGPGAPPAADRPTAILCSRGRRVTAFDLDQVARFRRFLRLAATPEGRTTLRSDPEWAAYLRLDTLDRYVESREGEQAGG
jgi:hypothetical protein